MTTKHTPGPWDVSRNGSSGYWIGAAEEYLANVPRNTAYRSAAEANASLIAAAPELLAALKALYARTPDTSLGVKDPTVAAARAAIAKAEGGES